MLGEAVVSHLVNQNHTEGILLRDQCTKTMGIVLSADVLHFDQYV